MHLSLLLVCCYTSFMLFSDHILLRIIIFVLGLCGFWVAKHIRKQKKTGKLLVCPIRFDCHAVIHSDYSKFFGIPVEILGMAYYGLVSISYFFYIFLPGLLPNPLTGFMIFLSVVAFIFSIYLICVQIFILRKGCSWCFASALISVLIFILTVYTYDGSIVQIFLK